MSTWVPKYLPRVIPVYTNRDQRREVWFYGKVLLRNTYGPLSNSVKKEFVERFIPLKLSTLHTIESCPGNSSRRAS